MLDAIMAEAQGDPSRGIAAARARGVNFGEMREAVAAMEARARPPRAPAPAAAAPAPAPAAPVPQRQRVCASRGAT
jgi:hypothetical protein